MIRTILVSLALLVLGATVATAQTYNLPDKQVVDYIVYAGPNGPYANLFDSENRVEIDGVPFYVSINGHLNTDMTLTGTITFWNLETSVQTTVPATGTVSSFATTATQANPVVIMGAFGSPQFSGAFTLKFYTHSLCGRYGCRPYWAQFESTVTVE